MKILRSKPKIIVKRNFRSFSEHAFLLGLFYSDINYTMAIPDPNLALDYFIKTFISIIDIYAPHKRLRIKNRNNPWFCSEVAEMLCIRDAAWRKAQTTKSYSDWQ